MSVMWVHGQIREVACSVRNVAHSGPEDRACAGECKWLGAGLGHVRMDILVPLLQCGIQHPALDQGRRTVMTGDGLVPANEHNGPLQVRTNFWE